MEWELCSETTPGLKNVSNIDLVDKSKIYLPALHIKFSSTSVKVMDKESRWFA